MNVSRIALLSAVLFVAPVFSSQAPDTTATDASVQTAPQAATQAPTALQNVENTVKQDAQAAAGLLSKLVAGAVAIPMFFANTGLDITGTIAKYSVNPVLNYIANISYVQGGRVQSFLQNDATGNNNVGDAIILLAATIGAYKLYNAYNAQDDSDDMIFVGDEYSMDAN